MTQKPGADVKVANLWQTSCVGRCFLKSAVVLWVNISSNFM